MTSRMVKALALLVAMSGAPGLTASAQGSADDLSARGAALGQCFVNRTTGEDRIAVARWLLAAIGSAPKMADVTRVDPARKVAVDKAMAVIFTRLITKDCAAEARPLLKSKTDAGFRAAGEALGRIAMTELLADPKAAQGVASYTDYLNEADFADLRK